MSVIEKDGDGYYVKLDSEFGDEIILAVLKEARQGVYDSIEHTVNLVAQRGLQPNHRADIKDNMDYLIALDRIIAYYGG